MVCGALGVPACGDSITGGGAGLPGEPEGCPALVFARGFLILVSSVSARAREGWPQSLYWRGFRSVADTRLFLHFPGAILHFPGESYIFRAQFTAHPEVIHRAAKEGRCAFRYRVFLV